MMRSNFKPIYFTLTASALITIVSSLILIGLFHYLNVGFSFLLTGIFAVSVFTITYLTIYLYFKYYFLRNINEILKDISGFPAGNLEYKTMNFNENVIETINNKVRGWIDENKKEMDKYKVLSDYRKQFIGDISHELKTPLFSVQGYLHTLIDGAIFDKDNNMQFLKKAVKNADRLESIVSDLDMISKFEVGEIIISKSNFNIRNMFQDVFDELELSASEKNIDLTFKPGEMKNFSVFADRKQIRHVCTNLVSNAIHYGKNEGYVKIGFKENNDKILVEVMDDGIGIPEKHLVHLFDRFYRIDASRSRNKGGSGLGLSIVKHILNGHNESINIESEPGKGSTFTFTLEKSK